MKKIIVVDDDQEVSEVVKIYLEEAGYQVVLCNSAINCLEKIKNESFDLVITDILMPEMNGIELTEKLRGFNPKQRILAYSGGGGSGKLVASLGIGQAIDEGANSGLMKPFTEEELLAVVRRLVS